MLTEERLTLIYLVLLTPTIMVTPEIIFLLIGYIHSPGSIFSSNPWYLPLPVIGLFILMGLILSSTKKSRKIKQIIWILSAAYWAAWIIYYVIDKNTGLGHWIIWFWHILLALISILMIYRISFIASSPTVK